MKTEADDFKSIIPISDNGGSSSELIRVFGGPGIGDVRSEYFPSLFQFGGVEKWSCTLNLKNRINEDEEGERVFHFTPASSQEHQSRAHTPVQVDSSDSSLKTPPRPKQQQSRLSLTTVSLPTPR
jgi:hypothetical protein